MLPAYSCGEQQRSAYKVSTQDRANDDAQLSRKSHQAYIINSVKWTPCLFNVKVACTTDIVKQILIFYLIYAVELEFNSNVRH